MLIPILTLSILRLRTTIFSCSKVIIAETYNLSLTDSAYDKTMSGQGSVSEDLV